MIVNITIIIFILYSIFKIANNFLLDISFNSKVYILILTLEHFIITGIFAFFLEDFTSINDPQRFYKIALKSNSWFSLFGFGNTFMSFLVYPFAKIGISLKVLFFLFSLIGWSGFLNLFKALDYRIQKKISFLYFLFLIPSIHLWTSSLSKEPLLLFFISVIINQIKTKNLINYKTLICLVIILFIRPHAFALLSLVLIVIFLLNDGSITLKRKINVLLVSLLAIFVGLYFSIVYFLKIEKFSVDYFKYRIQLFIDVNSNSGNAGISLLETNIFERILYLMYMPLPLLYNSENFFQLYISLENLVYVMLTLYIIYQIIFKKNKSICWNNDTIFALLTSILMIFLFGSYLYNYGLGNRMRIMFYPTLFFVLIKIQQQKVFDH